MKTFFDNYGNEFVSPYIPEKIVGFCGIDPSQKGLEKTEIVTLTAEQTALINQMINNYILRLQIHIDGGDITQGDDTPAPIFLTVKPNEVPHEELDTLLGGDDNGHYHLTEDELQKLNKLINTLIPNGDDGDVGDVEVDHEQLSNLLGGVASGHYHLTNDELDKIKILITTVFPSGSNTPVFPSGGGSGTGGGGRGSGTGGSGSGTGGGGSGTGGGGDDSSGGNDEEDLSYAGLPKIAPPAWKSNTFSGARSSFTSTSNSSSTYSAWYGVHRMYYGDIPIKFSNAWPTKFLVVPMSRDSSTTVKYFVCTQDLKTWYYWCTRSGMSTSNQYTADYIFITTSSKYYMLFLDYPNTVTTILYKNQNISNGGYYNGSLSMYGDGRGWIACCYSQLLNLYIFASANGYINRYDPTSGSNGAIRKERIYTGLSTITPSCIACAPIGETSQILCVTGPEGTATSVNGDIWSAHTDAPHNLRDIAYHEDIGGFLAWSNDDKHFYKSADGETWYRHSAKAIPLDDVVTVAYSPDVDWYCAIGGNSKHAYFTQNFKNWIETTVSTANIPMGSVIWMPSTHKFVLMPSSGATYYTFDPADWK